ncbi:MAG: YceI family protein [Salinibacter sp.]
MLAPLQEPSSGVRPCLQRSWIVWTLVLLSVLLSANARGQIQVTPHRKSQFWIHGKATGRTFTCEAPRVEGTGRLPAREEGIPKEASGEHATVTVRVPVRAIDCGNSMMTNDLQEALKMEQHPKIRFQLVHATVNGRVDTSAHWRRVDVLGPLTVAGTKRLVGLDAAARALDENHFRLRGCLPIRMTHFNIDPPTKAFGLIKVKNRVEVQFDLLAQTTSADSAPLDTLSLTNPPSCRE